MATDEQRRRTSARNSARAGAQIAPLAGLGHWWFTQDPQRAARTDQPLLERDRLGTSVINTLTTPQHRA